MGARTMVHTHAARIQAMLVRTSSVGVTAFGSAGVSAPGASTEGRSGDSPRSVPKAEASVMPKFAPTRGLRAPIWASIGAGAESCEKADF